MSTDKGTLTIIPVYESAGEGNGWDVAPSDALATMYEVDNGDRVVAFVPTRAEADTFIASATPAEYLP